MTREQIVEGLMEYRQAGWTGINDYYRPYVSGALLLLKAQKPRLVTREDFQQPPAYDGVLPCWKESRSKTRRSGWVAIVYGKALQDLEMGVARYWTGVPTEKQRREMDWPQK